MWCLKLAHIRAVAENCLSERVCVCVFAGSWGIQGMSGCSHSLLVLQERCAMCVSEHDVSYHVVSKNTEVWAHARPPPAFLPTTPYPPTLHKHSAKAQ